MSGAGVAAVGVLTGWGEGTATLPDDARSAAAGRAVVPLQATAPAGERFRRATRECVLGVAAVEAMLRAAGLDRGAIAGPRTALVYVTAGAYGAANRAFIEAASAGSALHFPYTAPSAVLAEVAIEFHLTGPYVILIGGSTATVDALWQASTIVARGTADRAVVLAVETFEECADLYARARWLVGRPLVEAAACALLVAGDDGPVDATPGDHDDLAAVVRRRSGETLACAPLIGLALAREAGRPATATGAWRDRRVSIGWAREAPGERAGGAWNPRKSSTS